MSTYYAIEGAARFDLVAFERLLAYGLGAWLRFAGIPRSLSHTDLLDVTVEAVGDDDATIVVTANVSSYRNTHALPAALVDAARAGAVEGGFLLDTTDGATCRQGVIVVDGVAYSGSSDCLGGYLVMGEPEVRTLDAGKVSLDMVLDGPEARWVYPRTSNFLDCSCAGWDDEDERGLCAVHDDGADPWPAGARDLPEITLPLLAPEPSTAVDAAALLRLLVERALAGTSHATRIEDPRAPRGVHATVAGLVASTVVAGRVEHRDLLARHLTAVGGGAASIDDAPDPDRAWRPGPDSRVRWIPALDSELHGHGVDRLAHGCVLVPGGGDVHAWILTDDEGGFDAGGLSAAMLETAGDLIGHGTDPADALDTVRRIHQTPEQPQDRNTR